MISKVFRILLWAMLCNVAALPLKAQTVDLNASALPAVVTVGKDMTYTISIVNTNAFIVYNFLLNVTFSESVNYLSSTNVNGTATLQGSAVVYTIASINPGQAMAMGLRIQPTRPGSFLTYFQWSVDSGTSRTKELLTSVYSVNTDLAVRLVSPTNTFVAGDQIQYQVSITNAGPEAVSSTLVTNQLPATTTFLGISPSAQVTQSGSQLKWTTGAIPVGSNITYRLLVQPNGVGTNSLIASAYGTFQYDPSPANNFATNQLSFGQAVDAGLLVSVVSTQSFNPQTGLMQQRIRLVNGGAATVATPRIMVNGLTNQLFNAAGTNNSVPFVLLLRPLAPAGVADLLLEYAVPTRQPVPDPVLSAYSVPQFIPAAMQGTPVSIDAFHLYADGSLMLEFPATNGVSYQVQYTDNVTFTNAWRALPTVPASSSRVQWIDYGPPKTSWRPDQVPRRFYRVIRLPD